MILTSHRRIYCHNHMVGIPDSNHRHRLFQVHGMNRPFQRSHNLNLTHLMFFQLVPNQRTQTVACGAVRANAQCQNPPFSLFLHDFSNHIMESSGKYFRLIFFTRIKIIDFSAYFPFSAQTCLHTSPPVLFLLFLL